MERIACALLLTLLSTFQGVNASVNDSDSDPRDPWEGLNRAVFVFNDTADQYVLKPVAKGYRNITPTFVDQSLANFLIISVKLRISATMYCRVMAAMFW